ncbi:MAG: ATP phosphoribosyltransferase [Bacteroidales bacterium]|nr:ATP phosphoribosyltransferase [Bacteroidales bacterium]
MIRIAIQTKGRLNEESVGLLRDAGIRFREDRRRFLLKSTDFPVEALYLRDDDIPEAVRDGAADAGIVGYNEVAEKGFDVEVLMRLSFGRCRLSLAVPENAEYTGPDYFNGKTIATSYPNILSGYLKSNNIDANVRVIAGSVEIAPAAGLADSVFDIVSSGATLVSNGLEEVEKVLDSEAVLIVRKGLPEEKKALLDELVFRFTSVINGRDAKYLLMNLPSASIDKAVKILPALRSPTIMPLAQSGWSSMHSVVKESELWDKIASLKEIGAEGILVLDVEKIIL